MTSATTTIEGYVGVEPELSQSRGAGKSVITLSVPHQRSKRLEGGGFENVGQTTWYEATFWEDLAESIADQVHKGTAVTITGIPELQVYERRDGTKGAKVVLYAPKLSLTISSRRTGNRNAAYGSQNRQGDQSPADVWNASQQRTDGQSEVAWETATPGGAAYDESTPF